MFFAQLIFKVNFTMLYIGWILELFRFLTNQVNFTMQYKHECQILKSDYLLTYLRRDITDSRDAIASKKGKTKAW